MEVVSGFPGSELLRSWKESGQDNERDKSYDQEKASPREKKIVFGGQGELYTQQMVFHKNEWQQ